MRIAVVGAGGVGGYFGGRLAEAGYDVGFVSRGAHGEAMAQDGLRLISPSGDAHIKPVRMIDPSAGPDPHDAILVAVKMYDLADAAEAIAPLIGPEAPVVPFQNGVESESILSEKLPPGHVVGATCGISAFIDAPGVVKQIGSMAWAKLAELDGSSSDRCVAVAKALDASGVRSEIPDDINLEIWSKFRLLVSMAAACCIYRSPLGPIREDEDKRAFVVELTEEAVAVGRAEGAQLPDGEGERVAKIFDRLPAEMKASMLVDLEPGKRLELDWLSGAVVRLAAKHGIDAPAHEMVCEALADARLGHVVDR